MREVRLLQLVSHPNVVRLLEAYQSSSGRLYLVFEHVEHTLLQQLRANKSGMPAAMVQDIAYQLLQALSYLHELKVRLKP